MGIGLTKYDCSTKFENLIFVENDRYLGTRGSLDVPISHSGVIHVRVILLIS